MIRSKYLGRVKLIHENLRCNYRILLGGLVLCIYMVYATSLTVLVKFLFLSPPNFTLEMLNGRVWQRTGPDCPPASTGI